MATNSSSTPIVENQKSQNIISNVENSTEWTQESTKSKVMRYLLALQLAIWGSWVAMAADLPKDMSVKSPDAKELVVWEKEQISFNWTNYDTSDLKIIKPEGIKVEMDKVAEIEMLDLYKTKKWWDKVIERYNSLLDRYKARIVKYYKETKEQWLPLRAVSFKIKTFDNYQQWKIFLFDATKTWKVWNMPETIWSALNGLLEIDEKWQAKFTKEEFQDFQVTDNSTLLIVMNDIAKIKAEWDKLKAEWDKLEAERVRFEEQNKMLSELYDKILILKWKK